MAANYWLDVSSDWSSGSNWSTGAAPTASDDVYILSGSRSITNCPGAGASVNYQSFTIGPEFAGSLGTAAAPCHIGSVVGDVKINAIQAQQIHLGIGTSKSANIEVYGTGARSTHPLAIYGPGTATRVNIHSAQLVRLAASSVVTLLVVGPGGRVIAESGASLTTARVVGGTVDCYAAATTVELLGSGLWNHLGDTTYNITTLLLAGSGALFSFGSDGGTITTANMYHGARLNCNAGTGRARAITTLNQYSGVLDLRGRGGTVTISTHNLYGGDRLVGPPPGP